MKKLFLTLTTLLFAGSLFAQPVVNNASKLAWDYTGDATEIRLYIEQTAGIVPDGVSFDAQIAPPPAVQEWPIQGLPEGLNYAVATAYYGALTPPVESGPSNEVDFIVISSPANLTVIVANLLVSQPDRGKLSVTVAGKLAVFPAD